MEASICLRKGNPVVRRDTVSGRLERRNVYPFSSRDRVEVDSSDILRTIPRSVLVKRGSDKGGLVIIMTDVIVLSLVLAAALSLISYTVYRRKARRRMANSILQAANNVGGDLEASQQTNNREVNEDRTFIFSTLDNAEVDLTRSDSSNAKRLAPAASSPTSFIAPSPPPKVPPTSYRKTIRRDSNINLNSDPYTSPTDTTGYISARHSIARKPSSSSNNTSRYLSSIARFSTRSFDEVALSDARSGILSRNQSIKSTIMLTRSFSRTSWLTARTERPASSVPEIPALPSRTSHFFNESPDVPQAPYRMERPLPEIPDLPLLTPHISNE